MDTREREFLLRAYEVLTSEGYKRYIVPLIHDRIGHLEGRIIEEDKMDAERRYAVKELKRIVMLEQSVKKTVEEGVKLNEES